jgi:hypothetical protein
MQLSSPTLLKQFSNVLQGELFPAIASATGPLSKHSRLLIVANHNISPRTGQFFSH